MTTVTPYLRFNDEKCREAMTFYQKCLGGTLTFQTIGETPMAKDMPEDAQDRIMHSTLKSGNIEFFGSDMMRDKAIIGDNVAVALNFDNEKDLRATFDKLAEGGEIFMAPEKSFWGIFGMLTDRYGIEWMLNVMAEK